MTTINKKSYQPPTVEVVCIISVQPLLSGSTLDVTIEDDVMDITEQDAPMIIDLNPLEVD